MPVSGCFVVGFLLVEVGEKELSIVKRVSRIFAILRRCRNHYSSGENRQRKIVKENSSREIRKGKSSKGAGRA